MGDVNVTKAARGISKTDRYKEALRGLASQATELANKLGVGGPPLTPDQIQLIRMAQLPMLKDELDGAVVHFMTGRPLEEIMDSIERLFDDRL